MKYDIKWEYLDNRLEWSMQISNSSMWDMKDFIMEWMANLTAELFTRMAQTMLNERTEEISEDQILWALCLVAIMSQNSLSEKLTAAINNIMWDMDIDKDEEDEDSDPWSRLRSISED